MRPLLLVLGLFWRAHRGAFLVGLAMMITTLLAGIGLLGLSGWFITASALAGMSGIGLSFDFFRPSAGVRFLALARAAARYSERLTTHDATLHFLAALRIQVFKGLAGQPFAALGHMRRATALNRLTTDVDALDMVYLRLLAPGLAALLSIGIAALIVTWLADVIVAAWMAGILVVGGGLGMLTSTAIGKRASRCQALALDAIRVRLIDLFQGATELAMANRLADQRQAVAKANRRARETARELDRADRITGGVLRMTGALAVSGTLLLGATSGLAPEIIAFSVFVALAMTEAIAPLQRGALELGRVMLAARRLAPSLEPAPPNVGRPPPNAEQAIAEAAGLAFEHVTFARASNRPILSDLSFSVTPGEWVALAGPSGCGKSTALLLAAGLETAGDGHVLLSGLPLAGWPEKQLRQRLCLVPQRPELFAGTIAENLRLAAPDVDDDRLIDALRTVALDGVITSMGGLDARLGEGGTGLSGGELRRLALARLVLRNPAVALLDEPTEGLDSENAGRVLQGLRAALPEAAFLTASHRQEELAFADRVIDLDRRPVASDVRVEKLRRA